MDSENWRVPFTSLRQNFVEASQTYPRLEHMVLKLESLAPHNLYPGQIHTNMEAMAKLLPGEHLFYPLWLAIGGNGRETEVFYIWGPKDAVVRFRRLAHIGGNCLPEQLRSTQTILPFSTETEFPLGATSRWIYFLFSILAAHPGTLVHRQAGNSADGEMGNAAPLAQITINLFHASVMAIDIAILADSSVPSLSKRQPAKTLTDVEEAVKTLREPLPDGTRRSFGVIADELNRQGFKKRDGTPHDYDSAKATFRRAAGKLERTNE